MTPFTSGLFSTLEGQLSEARDFGLDMPSISDQTYSYEHLVCCLALIRQAQLTVSELKDHVASLEGGESDDFRAAERIRNDAVRIQHDAERVMRENENANDSDVRATTALNADDDPVALARSMQGKRHGAPP